jgi:hypothetical protein
MMAMCWPALAPNRMTRVTSGLRLELLAQDGGRAVAAAVVDEDDFVASPRASSAG